MCVSVLLSPTGVDSEENRPGRRPESIGDQAEARQGGNGPPVLDSGHERLAERFGQLVLAQPERDPPSADLRSELASERRVGSKSPVFSNS